MKICIVKNNTNYVQTSTLYDSYYDASHGRVQRRGSLLAKFRGLWVHVCVSGLNILVSCAKADEPIATRFEDVNSGGLKEPCITWEPGSLPPVGEALRPFVGVLCPLVFVHVHHSATAKTLYIPGDRALDSVIWRLAAEGESSLLLATDAASCCSRPRPVSSVTSSLLSSTCTSAPLLRPCAQLDPDPVHQHTMCVVSFKIHYMDFPDCLLLLLSISVFLLFSFFSVFTLF